MGLQREKKRKGSILSKFPYLTEKRKRFIAGFSSYLLYVEHERKEERNASVST